MPALNEANVKINQYVLENIPKEVEITRIEYEGPALAIYTKKPEILIEQSYVVASVVSLIRKRIVVRSDPSVRLPEKETEKVISEIVSREAEITSVSFDPSLGEVVIEAKKPGLVIGKNGARNLSACSSSPLLASSPRISEGRCSKRISSSASRSIALSITFLSSRTFPGQSCLSRASRASLVMDVTLLRLSGQIADVLRK